MTEDLLIGLAALAIPLLAIGYLALRRNPAIFRLFLALLLVGLGYLTATGALTDIGRVVQGKDAPAATTATERSPPPAEPASPPAEPAPAPAEPAPAPAEPAPEPAEPPAAPAEPAPAPANP